MTKTKKRYKYGGVNNSGNPDHEHVWGKCVTLGSKIQFCACGMWRNEDIECMDEFKEKTTCPNCGKEYVPLIDRYPENRMKIQRQYALSNLILKEQKITGICSDKCWDEFCGVK